MKILSRPEDRNAYAKRVEGRKTPLERWLFDRFGETGLVPEIDKKPMGRRLLEAIGLSSSRTMGLRDVLSEAVASIIPDGEAKPDGINQVLENQVTRTARQRSELDELFAGLVLPGNRLELFDGLHSKESIEKAIAPQFNGILDLTTCTSTVLADYISSRRRQRFRTVQMPTVQEVLWGAKCVEQTLGLVRDRGMPYLEARSVAAAALEWAIRELGNRDSHTDT